MKKTKTLARVSKRGTYVMVGGSKKVLKVKVVGQVVINGKKTILVQKTR